MVKQLTCTGMLVHSQAWKLTKLPYIIVTSSKLVIFSLAINWEKNIFPVGVYVVTVEIASLSCNSSAID